MTLHEKVVITAFTGCPMVDPEQLDAYAQQLFGRQISAEEYKQPEFWEALQEKSFDDFLDIRFSLDLNEFNKLRVFQRKYKRLSGETRKRYYRSHRLHRV